jgi:hypothetical protein
VEIVSYSSEHREAVERMNSKLSAAGSEWHFPTGTERPPAAEQLPVWTESFVAVEDGDVYGGYILKHQQFFAAGRPLAIGNLQLPLSMGHIDSSYSNVSAALLFDVLRRTPCAYAIGLGAPETDFARLLGAAGWKHMTVPFYFKVKAATRFARNIRLPPDKANVQRALRALGSLRLAGLALRARTAVTSRPSRRSVTASYDGVRELDRFDAGADQLFEAHAASYSLVGDRRAAALNCVYPEDEARYIRIAVERRGNPVGWAVLLDTAMQDDKYFGDLRLGSLVDCFAAPEDVVAVVTAADRFLTERGVDLVVSNQLHSAWCGGLEAAGYQSGPSNLFFYYSRDLAAELSAIPGWARTAHMNRGDGEGPTNL